MDPMKLRRQRTHVAIITAARSLFLSSNFVLPDLLIRELPQRTG
jgi:hypothetical protein